MSEISTKEYGTIVFALEEYAQVLEKEGSYQTRNYVYELIWKLQEKESGYMLKIDSQGYEYCLPCADALEIEGVIVEREGECEGCIK